MTPSFVRIDVGKGHTVTVKPALEEQFGELAEMFREQALTKPNSIFWMMRITANVWRYSPKMRCWLIRESFAALSDFYREEGNMKGKEQANGADKVTADWRFVNITLSDDQRTAAVSDYTDTDTLWDTLVTVLRDGYKVTLSYDAETDSFCAALSGTNCGKPNERLSLTAWGETEVEALQYVLYKHVTVLEFVWERPGVKAKRLG